MQTTEKQKLKRQLEQQAGKIMELDGKDLNYSLLATCNALLRMAEQSLAKEEHTEITDEIYANYFSFAVKVNRFYEQHAQNDGGSDRAINEKLQQVLEEVQDKRNRMTSLQAEYDNAYSANEILQAQIDDLQNKLQEQMSVKDALDKMYEDCRPEVIEEKKKKNEELFSELTEKKEERKKLELRYHELSNEKKSVIVSIDDTEKAIHTIPEEIVALRTKYKELEALLLDLQNAEKEYNSEKQAELQKKIDALMPVVEENRVATEVLGNRLESLQQQNIEYNAERHTLTTNIIKVIQSSMGDLKRYLTESEEFLNETQKTADTLAGNLVKCQERYEEYRAWYDTSKTPLDVMIASLEYLEYTDLRKSLDVGQIPELQKKFEEIRKNLQDIDYILGICARATQKDLQRIKRRAGQ